MGRPRAKKIPEHEKRVKLWGWRDGVHETKTMEPAELELHREFLEWKKLEEKRESTDESDR